MSNDSASSTGLRLSFSGAAKRVTGSSHTLTLESGRKILLDYGMFQGRRAEADELNRSSDLDPSEYDAVIVSHAHIDHTGRLPKLVKAGYRGPIYATPVTVDLCNYMLLDSASIQQQDYMYLKTHAVKTSIPIEPMYDEEDVRRTMKQMKSKAYHVSFKVNDEVTCTFLEAGHVLGSAIVRLDIKTGKRQKVLVFSGDLGRKNLPILRDPDRVTKADYLICESTYGDRIHEGASTIDEDVERVLDVTFRRGGRVIIPAFALERTQELVYRLHRIFRQGRLPKVPIYVDSPMAAEVTDVFRRHPEVYDEELRQEFTDSGDNPFSVGLVKYTGSVEESKHLNHLKGSAIIISASGMCEEGRIRHHLAHALPDEKNTIMIVGYQAEETLGRKLVDGVKAVPIFGKTFDVRADIVVFDGFSAHADKNDLDNFVKSIGDLKQVFLVHGEVDQQEAFAKRVRTFCDAEVVIPERGESFDLR